MWSFYVPSASACVFSGNLGLLSHTKNIHRRFIIYSQLAPNVIVSANGWLFIVCLAIGWQPVQGGPPCMPAAMGSGAPPREEECIRKWDGWMDRTTRHTICLAAQ